MIVVSRNANRVALSVSVNAPFQVLTEQGPLQDPLYGIRRLFTRRWEGSIDSQRARLEEALR